jgi:LysR family cyn operon transcriptional activator
LDNSVEFRHLRYFAAIADSGSFTRAAALIGLRQPTLSHQIRQLENVLGSPLFHRARRNCRLTATGEMLLPFARRILRDMDDARRALDDVSGLQRGSLSIGVLPVVGHRVLPAALTRFHLEHPGIRVRVVEMSVDDMERALSIGTVDLGLGFMPPSETSLRAQLLYAEDLVAVVRPSDPLAGRASINVEELAKRALAVAPPGFGTRTILLNAFGHVRRTPTFSLEISSVDSLLDLVRDCGEVGIVPSSALWSRHEPGLHVVRIVRPTPRRQIGILHVYGMNLSPAFEAFSRVVKSTVEELMTRAGAD